MIALFWKFVIGTALLLWRCVKYGLLSKYLFQRKQQYGGWKNLEVTTSFKKNNSFHLSHGIKNIHRSKLHL